MFDFVFDWRDELNLGIKEIDEQHKRLFKIGRDMEQLVRFNCVNVTDKQLLDIVCELRDFVVYHFYEEERFMELCGFEGLEEHRKKHKEFTEYVSKIDCPKLKENPGVELKKIKDTLQDWIFKHMLVEDTQMVKKMTKRYEDMKTLFEE